MIKDDQLPEPEAVRIKEPSINSDSCYIKTPTEKEIIQSYCAAGDFYRGRESWYLKTAKWYRNKAYHFLSKSDQNKKLAENAKSEKLTYWGLAFIAKTKIEKREGASHG